MGSAAGREALNKARSLLGRVREEEEEEEERRWGGGGRRIVATSDESEAVGFWLPPRRV